MKRYTDTRIFEFFGKVAKTMDNNAPAENVMTYEDAIADQQLERDEQFSHAKDLTTDSSGISHTAPNTAVQLQDAVDNPNDFGLAVGAKILSDADKMRFLTEFYTPPESYAWPTATRTDRGKTITCRLRRSELLKHPCLAYSPKLEGVLHCTFHSWTVLSCSLRSAFCHIRILP